MYGEQFANFALLFTVLYHVEAQNLLPNCSSLRISTLHNFSLLPIELLRTCYHACPLVIENGHVLFRINNPRYPVGFIHIPSMQIRYDTAQLHNVLFLFILDSSDRYTNYWQDGVFYYMGMGKGEQSLNRAGNRRLAESRDMNTTVYLIERDEKSNCRFCGEVKLSGEPFYKKVNDKYGVSFNAVYFPSSMFNKPPTHELPFDARTGALTHELPFNTRTKTKKPGGMNPRACFLHVSERSG